jgi:hypothetical protein
MAKELDEIVITSNSDEIERFVNTYPVSPAVFDQLIEHTRSRHDATVRGSGIPPTAETIISYICTPDRLEAVLGDLERNFARRAAKHSEKAARRWYWWQTTRTVAAFGVQIAVKLVIVREMLRKLGL